MSAALAVLAAVALGVRRRPRRARLSTFEQPIHVRRVPRPFDQDVD